MSKFISLVGTPLFEEYKGEDYIASIISLDNKTIAINKSLDGSTVNIVVHTDNSESSCGDDIIAKMENVSQAKQFIKALACLIASNKFEVIEVSLITNYFKSQEYRDGESFVDYMNTLSDKVKMARLFGRA